MTRIGKMLLGGLLLSGAGIASAQADNNVSVYKPIQGLSYSFGSKLAVGYFTQKDGACALNVFLAENTGGNTGPSASQLQFKVAPGENVKLNSEEGAALELRCGAEAATLEVKGGSAPARFVSR